MKFVNLLLAIAVSLLMGLLVFEGGLRLIGMGPPTTLNAFDADRGWANKPDETITRKSVEGFKVTYAFNAHGMRDDTDLEPAKPANTTRVLALGDSFTLGLTVSRNDLFVDLLEDWWNAEGRRVQVLNTGTEAYSTDQQVAWLEAHGEEWKPDVVLIFPYENDVYWNGQTSYTGFEKPRFTAAGELEPRTLENHIDRGFLGSTAIGRMFGGGGERPPTFTPGSRPMLEEFGVLLDSAPDFMAEPIARTTGALKALKAKCDAIGAKALVVPIPSHSCVDPAYAEKFVEERVPGLAGVAWSGDNPVEIFLDAAAAAGLESLDVREPFRSRTKGGEDLYFFKDWHINPAGNHELAELVHGKVDELGFLPAATKQVPLEPAGAAPTSSPRWPWFYGALTLLLGSCYSFVYRRTERFPVGFLKVAALLAVIFTIAIGGTTAIAMLPPQVSRLVLVLVILVILGFVLYKLGDRVGTITELLGAFIGRGHWYLMPLVTVLLTIGSLLVVAASSPLVAPFIYTLF